MSFISNSIEDFKERLGILSPQALENPEYLERLDSIKKELAEIQNDSEYSIEASRWLCDRQYSLVQYSFGLIFDQYHRVRGEEHITVSDRDYKDFEEDLNQLFYWINDGLAAGGMNPKIFRKKLLALPIEYRFYTKAFQYILNDKIMNADTSVVSIDALQILIDYFNRFLIDQEFQE